MEFFSRWSLLVFFDVFLYTSGALFEGVGGSAMGTLCLSFFLFGLMFLACHAVFTFDNSCGLSTNFDVIGGSRSKNCGGYMQSDALYFNGGFFQRELTSRVIQMPRGGVVSFSHKLGNGDAWSGCEMVDPGEGVVLEARSAETALNLAALNWGQLFSSNDNIPHFQTMRVISVPITNFKPFVQLRWRQLSDSGQDYDTWMVDNVVITGGGKCTLSGE